MLTVPVAWGETYQCMDATGTVIYTDSPSQLTRCVTATNPSPNPLSSKGGGQEISPSPISSPTKGEDFRTMEQGRGEGEGMAVPVTKAGRSLVVQAKLNGTRDARLILDTGADITILSRTVAMDIGLLPSQTVATVTLNTAGGSVRADVFRVGTVSVGSAEARNVAAAVHDLPDAPAGVDGLLGLTFLERFLVTVDAQKGELHLRARP